jgi:hypothetical protein
MVIAAAVCAVIVVTDQLRCADAAAIAARLAARGEPPAVVRSVALRAAPHGVRLRLLTTATTVTATVISRLEPPGILHRLPAIVTHEQVAAARETAAAEVR